MADTIISKNRAIIYCRVSTDKQEQDGESLEYQENKCRQYAELHNIDVVTVLAEAKSGFIHYSLREKLTLARQFIRDCQADMIIVWDLRRFSRNFVHSALIFEEIESHGGEVVSVSEKIDSSLTGKLIRSILAWSAESEREKIVEYANRRWQTRLELGLPVGTGRAPYGWEWGDKDKTFYMVNHEEAAIRFSIFQMFAELDMSIRGIAHKLTEDGIIPPARARGFNVKNTVWLPSTVHMMLKDVANIGTLQICKSKKALTAKGTETRRPNENMKTIPGGLPAIVPVSLFERAQVRLKTNRAEKSHLPHIPEDFLMKGYIYCKTCGYKMHSHYYRSKKEHVYPYYVCVNHANSLGACPALPQVRTHHIDRLVWEDCCHVFEGLDLIRGTIERNIQESLHTMLEDVQGKQLMTQLQNDIAYAIAERDKHPEGSYYYTLIDQDIRGKQDRLRRCEEEYANSHDVRKLADVYQQSIMGFLDFLNTMQGRYHEATFQEKRNALDVLGAKVYIHPDPTTAPDKAAIESGPEWLSVAGAAELTELAKRTLCQRLQYGQLPGRKNPQTRTWLIHRDDLVQFLEDSRIRPKTTEEHIEERVEVIYSPKFTGV